MFYGGTLVGVHPIFPLIFKRWLDVDNILLESLVHRLAIRSSTPVRAGVAGTALGGSEREAQRSRTGLSLSLSLSPLSYLYLYFTNLHSVYNMLLLCFEFYILIMWFIHINKKNNASKQTSNHDHSTFHFQSILIPNSWWSKQASNGSCRALSIDSHSESWSILKALTRLFSRRCELQDQMMAVHHAGELCEYLSILHIVSVRAERNHCGIKSMVLYTSWYALSRWLRLVKDIWMNHLWEERWFFHGISSVPCMIDNEAVEVETWFDDDWNPLIFYGISIRMKSKYKRMQCKRSAVEYNLMECKYVWLLLCMYVLLRLCTHVS